MRWAIQLLFLALALVIYSNEGTAEQLRSAENLRHEQVLLPFSTPDRARMATVDSYLFLEAGGGAGIFVFYDDASTELEIDYIEFYDVDGNLLLVSWIDRFGVCNVAMDRGLLNGDEPAVDGALVLIGVGQEL